jgi:hypothetical protein
MEHKCKNCLLLDKNKMQCKVAILIQGEQIHIPVFLEDDCHLKELNIEVDQVRWIENKDENNKSYVQIEYPENFFLNE